jgi:hypothetical protein
MTIEQIIEMAIDASCQKLDLATDETEKKVLQAEIFTLVEQLNGSTIYLTVQ